MCHFVHVKSGKKIEILVVTYNHRHKIMKHFKILAWFDSKVLHEIYYSNIVFQLPQNMPNDLRCRILGN